MLILVSLVDKLIHWLEESQIICCHLRILEELWVVAVVKCGVVVEQPGVVAAKIGVLVGERARLRSSRYPTASFVPIALQAFHYTLDVFLRACDWPALRLRVTWDLEP